MANVFDFSSLTVTDFKDLSRGDFFVAQYHNNIIFAVKTDGSAAFVFYNISDATEKNSREFFDHYHKVYKINVKIITE